jgi:hypothetical protein
VVFRLADRLGASVSPARGAEAASGAIATVRLPARALGEGGGPLADGDAEMVEEGGASPGNSLHDFDEADAATSLGKSAWTFPGEPPKAFAEPIAQPTMIARAFGAAQSFTAALESEAVPEPVDLPEAELEVELEPEVESWVLADVEPDVELEVELEIGGVPAPATPQPAQTRANGQADRLRRRIASMNKKGA